MSRRLVIAITLGGITTIAAILGWSGPSRPKKSAPRALPTHPATPCTPLSEEGQRDLPKVFEETSTTREAVLRARSSLASGRPDAHALSDTLKLLRTASAELIDDLKCLLEEERRTDVDDSSSIEPKSTSRRDVLIVLLTMSKNPYWLRQLPPFIERTSDESILLAIASGCSVPGARDWSQESAWLDLLSRPPFDMARDVRSVSKAPNVARISDANIANALLRRLGNIAASDKTIADIIPVLDSNERGVALALYDSSQLVRSTTFQLAVIQTLNAGTVESRDDRCQYLCRIGLSNIYDADVRECAIVAYAEVAGRDAYPALASLVQSADSARLRATARNLMERCKP